MYIKSPRKFQVRENNNKKKTPCTYDLKDYISAGNGIFSKYIFLQNLKWCHYRDGKLFFTRTHNNNYRQYSNNTSLSARRCGYFGGRVKRNLFYPRARISILGQLSLPKTNEPILMTLGIYSRDSLESTWTDPI